MSQTDIIEIPVSELGLDPLFQVRAVDSDEVRRLVEEWDPDECQPIWVRPWPASDTRPRPVGCEHAAYQVASGWTRTTAALVLGLATLPAIVQEMDDRDFRAWAVKGNQAHGRRMTQEEKRIQVAQLAQEGMPQREIAKKTGISQSTVSRMLAGNSSNASRAQVMRTNQPAHADVMRTNHGGELEDASQEEGDDATPLDAREVTQVGMQMARVWAAALPHLRVAAVRAWLSTLDGDERMREAKNALALSQWLIAYGNAAMQPRFTPEQLAATRRTSGETMDMIFNTLFADGKMWETILEHGWEAGA